MDLAAIRARLQGLLATIEGLHAYPIVPDQVVVPCATVGPAPGNFATTVTTDGARDLQFVVTVLVQKVVDDASQNALDLYLSDPLDIEDVFTTGRTANWDFTSAGPERNYGVFTFGTGDAAPQYLGFEVPVLVAVP